MSLNNTPSSERIKIGFFGLRNAGKSSLVNAFTGQNLAVVSSVKGTTTDPVKKSMEILPLGPVVIIDTPGIDDEGNLGALRVKKAKEVLAVTDIAILVATAGEKLSQSEKELLKLFEEKKLPYVIAYNKSDLTEEKKPDGEKEIFVSALKFDNIEKLKNTVAALIKKDEKEKFIVSDLIEKGDLVILVTPIDAAAPKGRLILPQQQTIRDILDKGAMALVVQDTELEAALSKLKEKPRMIVTDSQAFNSVAKIVPENIPLTSFSILFARYKGELKSLVDGAKALDSLKDGDKVLISEGCSHHRQCGDIGSVKIPALVKKHTNKNISFEFTSGGEFPEHLDDYAVVIHCGGCMLTEKEMKHRQAIAKGEKIPMVNYGMAIAHMNGILERSIQVFE